MLSIFLGRAALGLAVAILVWTGLVAAAQDGTGQPPTGPGAGCDGAPRPLAELVAFAAASPAPSGATLATPASSLADRLAFSTGGEPVDPEVIAGIEQTIEAAVACRAAGDAARYFALFTDRYLRDAFARGELDEAVLLGFARDATIAPWRLVGVQSVRLLPDGRASAVAIVASAPAGGEAPGPRVMVFGVTLAEGDGGWRIDGMAPLAIFALAEVEAVLAHELSFAEPTPTVLAGQVVRLEGYDIGWWTTDQSGPQVTLTVSPGTTIELVNVGAVPHNFTVEDLGISVDMPVGQMVTAQIPDDTPRGEYTFICNVPGHAAAGMRGTLVVR